ncbi:nicotinamide riboside transporter PnuC [Spirulina sp. CCNP1310]|uniref:nicotinamide riboside transporter PnuC n=1 Tax=Spirulina sp. CCNP1310 TaxID=3110249 RepID=UPI002B21553A|nr:nicotinamide riboside transporter PnuC [Spirulina sp. CCNP1310]MEA5420463.1 nicotinamide riboside transporter PnuC [Spirulina sp. CCNP1310]
MNTQTCKIGKIDRLWLVLLLMAGGVISAYLATSIFDATVLLSGVLCVGLIAIGRRAGYLIGLYNSLAYSVLAYNNGLFGEVYLNLLFFIPTSLIGYVLWSRHTQQDQTVAMRQLNGRQRGAIASLCILCTVGLGFLLALNPHQNTPFIDATTNVLSIVATFLMMGRYKEQWLFYILLNIVTIVMWLLRFQAGGAAGDLMVLMWLLFLLNALFGYWRWHLGVQRSKGANPSVNIEAKKCDGV